MTPLLILTQSLVEVVGLDDWLKSQFGASTPIPFPEWNFSLWGHYALNIRLEMHGMSALGGRSEEGKSAALRKLRWRSSGWIVRGFWVEEGFNGGKGCFVMAANGSIAGRSLKCKGKKKPIFLRPLSMVKEIGLCWGPMERTEGWLWLIRPLNARLPAWPWYCLTGLPCRALNIRSSWLLMITAPSGTSS